MTPTAGLEPSYAAIILVVVLVGLCFPLYFSMRKHVRRSTVPTEAEYRAAEQAENQIDVTGGGEGYREGGAQSPDPTVEEPHGSRGPGAAARREG